mmetsp:Transcript_16052/g.15771  ORF Transcript_16052/g.15771 Transcript_16052/m.15771 type:complete len:199 (-) Transcript_16052:610-1206(-)
MAFGQPFVISSPAKVAGVWFGDKERALATTLGSLAGPFGAVIGYLLPLPLISDSDTDPKSLGRSRMSRYILIQSIIITALTLPVLIFIRNRPPTPPSASAANSIKKKSDGLIKNSFRLLKNLNFLLLMVGFSSVYSIYTTLGAAIGPLTHSFGYNSRDNSLFGSIYIVGGVFGSFAHAIFLDKYSRYKMQFIIIGITN